MATLVVFADVADGLIEYSSATYATARAGSGAPSVDTTNTGSDCCGQALFATTYYVMESFYPFDTSSLGAGASISAAQVGIYGKTNHTTTDFTARIAAFDFGVGITTADWQDGTELAALTVLATFATSGFSTAAYNLFTDSGGMVASVNKTGTTRYVLYSDRQAAGTVPTGEEWFEAWFADNTGTTNDPKLTITYTTATTSVNAPNTAATGVSRSVSPKFGLHPDRPTAAGVAYQPTIHAGTTIAGLAGLATAIVWASSGAGSDLDVAGPNTSATGASSSPTPGVSPNPPHLALVVADTTAVQDVGGAAGVTVSATALALDPSALTTTGYAALADHASSDMAAYDAVAQGTYPSAVADISSATADAGAAHARVGAKAEHTSATGLAYGALQTYASPALVTATGAATSVQAAIRPTAGASVATASAQTPGTRVRVNAEAATATMSAGAVSMAVAFHPGLVSALGEAYIAHLGLRTRADIASASILAHGLNQSSTAAAGLAAASVSAQGVQPGMGARAGAGRAVMVAHDTQRLTNPFVPYSGLLVADAVIRGRLVANSVPKGVLR